MSKKANPAAIGAFVLGALVILVAAILIFGRGKFFVPVHNYTLFFSTSVKGLRVGAPVTFRGDRIGEVVEIRPLIIAGTSEIDIKVIIELVDDDQVQFVGEGPLTELDMDAGMEYLVNERGLRAKLALESMVTGQLFVDLDFYPEQPIRLKDIKTRYPQLPTIETGLQQFLSTLQELPIRETMKKVQNALDAITGLATSPQLPEILDDIHATAQNARSLTANLNSRVDQLGDDWLVTTDTARSTLVQAEKTLALEEGKPGEVASSFIAAQNRVSAAMRRLEAAAASIELAAKDVDSFIAEGTPVRAQLEDMISELAAAARSIRLLADYLERHPEAFIKGKQ